MVFSDWVSIVLVDFSVGKGVGSRRGGGGGGSGGGIVFCLFVV